jgi:hypothetical protein
VFVLGELHFGEIFIKLGGLQWGNILILTLQHLHGKHAVRRGIYTDAQTFNYAVVKKNCLSLHEMHAPSALEEDSVTAIRGDNHSSFWQCEKLINTRCRKTDFHEAQASGKQAKNRRAVNG